jgi:hypothetical protein
MQTPETTIALRTTLLHLAEDAADVASHPSVNKPELRDQIELIGRTCERIARAAEKSIPRSIADDLINLRSILKSAATLDEPTSFERSWQAKEASRALRALRSSVQDALEAACDVGLVPSETQGLPDVILRISRVELRPAWTDSIIKRLDGVLDRLNDLTEETQWSIGSSPQQKTILHYLDERMEVQIRVAKLLLAVGGTVDFGAVVRVVERIGSLASDFHETVKGMLRKLPVAVQKKAEILRQMVRRVASGVMTIVRVLQKRQAASDITKAALFATAAQASERPVFIIYARHDIDTARRLAEVLTNNDINIWWERRWRSTSS